MSTFLQWMQEQRGAPKRKYYPKKTFIEKQREKPMKDRILSCLYVLNNFAENPFLKEECDDLISTIEQHKDTN